MTTIYRKTDLGQSALQNRALALTPRQRSAFILFDGRRNVEEVLLTTVGLGVTQADIDHLHRAGLIEAQESGGDALAMTGRPRPDFADDSQFEATQAVGLQSLEVHVPTSLNSASSHDEQAAYQEAYAIAKRLLAGSGLPGFRLNAALEAAGTLQRLRELAPKIGVAVGPLKYRELQKALA